jgi:hypothetical protein
MEPNNNSSSDYSVDFAVTDSSNIIRIQASPDLLVTFKNNSVYKYQNVPQTLIEAFLEAPSKGQFLRSQIIPVYQAEKL